MVKCCPRTCDIIIIGHPSFFHGVLLIDAYIFVYYSFLNFDTCLSNK